MVWYVILGMLAAFGTLCILWILLGFLLPGSGRGIIVCLCREEDAVHLQRRGCWLRDLGLIRSPVLITSDPQEMQERLLREWTKFDAAGNGDPSRNHQRGGVSEL